MRELTINSKTVNLMAVNLSSYPNTVPLVTFSSDGCDFTLQIIAIVPYTITKDRVRFDTEMKELEVKDRDAPIMGYEVCIEAPQESCHENPEQTIHAYWIEIKYTISGALNLDDERIFVKFENPIPPLGVPETNRGTVVTTSKPTE